ncbi:MAG: hypothetical protein ACRERD_01165, partial [Candidatus Binatia bacterium]
MPATADTTISAPIRGIYGQLPLGFEANHGQVDRQVQYLARGQGYALFLTPGEAVLALQQGSGDQKRVLVTMVSMQLVGANPAPLVEGQDALPGKV